MLQLCPKSEDSLTSQRTEGKPENARQRGQYGQSPFSQRNHGTFKEENESQCSDMEAGSDISYRKRSRGEWLIIRLSIGP